MDVPALPPCFALAFHHEAELAVSGDTYFVHWDDASARLTLLVTDVTGHGIQSALKSSACQVIAKIIWSEEPQPGAVAWRSRFQLYERKISSFLSKRGETPDVAAILGIELDRRTGLAEIFRVNFTFPLIVEPVGGAGDDEGIAPGQGRWRVRLLAVQNRTVTTVQLVPNAFLLVLSDGFITSSRDASQLVKFLNGALQVESHADGGGDAPLTAERLRSAVIKSSVFAGRQVTDDRTLMVFQWLPHRAAGEGGLADAESAS